MAFSASMTVSPNDPRFSRREASGASEAVGWKRMLGGVMAYVLILKS